MRKTAVIVSKGGWYFAGWQSDLCWNSWSEEPDLKISPKWSENYKDAFVYDSKYSAQKAIVKIEKKSMFNVHRFCAVVQ